VSVGARELAVADDVDDAAMAGDVERIVGPLVEPHVAGLGDRLAAVDGLSDSERHTFARATAQVLGEVVWRRVSRVVVLELNAARVTGKLAAPDSAGRWGMWVEHLSRADGWQELASEYPPLLPRLRTIIGNRCAATVTLARRLARDRRVLPQRLGVELGEIVEVSFGAGDSHHGGLTVTVLEGSRGRVVYKPRSLAVDAALGELLPRLLPEEPDHRRIRVPAVYTGGDDNGRYGWAAHVPHRYCDGPDELRLFYRNLGHWLAVMRLLGGSDLHNENVIACGPVPVVVDCETLFTPQHRTSASGYGEGSDRAIDLLNGSVLRTGLLPGRAGMLGWRGVDASAAGFLPRQQPSLQVPVILDARSDRARIGMGTVPPPPSANHPGAEPDLGRYWHHVVDGFTEVTTRLRAMDAAGALEPLLASFADAPVRVVLRDTMAYATLGRMLWHPVSLHDPEPAMERARTVLLRHARNRPSAPDDLAVINAEIEDLLDGDIPTFTTTPRCGELTGPRRTRWGQPGDLTATALGRWRKLDDSLDRHVVRAALVGAYLNDGDRSDRNRLEVTTSAPRDPDRCRRAHAAGVVHRLAEHAVWGEDGTVTWIAPSLGPAGWAVQPLPVDLYGGGLGVAVLLAAYLREVQHGRADPVDVTERLLSGTLATVRRAEDKQAADLAAAQAEALVVRPAPAGGYIGLGSRIWGWLLLADLAGVDRGEAHQRAAAAAGGLAAAVSADEAHDLLYGAAGAVVPLLRLHLATGDQWWRTLAEQIGCSLIERALPAEPAGSRWPSPQLPEAVGGFAHGSFGIGWALARLAHVTASATARQQAEDAFAFTEALYDPAAENWRDTRGVPDMPMSPATWCHGAVGIGVAAADLLTHLGDDPAWGGAARWRDLLTRAAQVPLAAEGMNWSHTLCHGDLSVWEMMNLADDAGLAPTGYDRQALTGRLLASIEAHGPVSGLARDTFEPGLLAGQSGIAYQLLRLHPDCDLPSILLPGTTPGPRTAPG
jgi:type 2 lantibiotic biosynthesis protein LanM